MGEVESTVSASVDYTEEGGRKAKLSQCPNCDKRVANVKDHMKVHSEGKKICKVCNGKFKQSGSLKRHMVQIHNIKEGKVGNYEKKFKPDMTILETCTICGKEFHKYVLKKHLLTHERELVKCEYCTEEIKASRYISHLTKVHRKTGKHQESKAKNDKVYLNCGFCGKLLLKDNLKDHQKNHTTEKIFRCEECGAELKHKESFNRHLVQVHGKETGQPGSYTKTYKYGKKECTVCCKEVSSLSKHNRMHHSDEPPEEKKIKCESCDKMFKSRTARRYHFEQVHEDKYNYECKLCDKKYKQKILLKRHMRWHTDRYGQKCDECGKGFPLTSQLTKHKKLVHSVLTFDFECELCHHKFKTKGSLWIHKKSHEDAKVKCNQCEKVYKNNKGLSAHLEQVHSEEKKYECQQCGNKYKQQRMLLQHTKSVHQPKQFKCRDCEKCFAFHYDLTAHVKRGHLNIGKPKKVECLDCDKMFVTFSQMSAHALLVHGESKVECRQCGKKFKSFGVLSKHLITHTTEQPYKCGVCEKAYNNAGSRSRHRKVCKGAPELKSSCKLCDFTSKSTDQSVLNKVFEFHMNEKHSETLNQTTKILTSLPQR